MKNTPNVPPVEPVVAALRPFVSLLVREELARLNVLVAAVTYDRDHLPPGFTSAESFALACRKLRLDPATYRPGRSWTVPCDVWERARREEKERRRKPSQRPEPDSVDRMLQRSGLRLIRHDRGDR